jgi:O-antigen/teichoic acid export membrane protein
LSNVKTIARNTGILFFSSLASKALSFFFTMYSAQYLGDEGFGLLSYLLAVVGIIGIFTDIGLAQLMTREVARDRSRTGKYFYNTIVIKLLLILVTLVAVTVYMAVVRTPPEIYALVYLFVAYIIFMHFSGVFNSLFQAYERMELQSIGDIVLSALLLAGTLMIIGQGSGIDSGMRVAQFALLYTVSAAIVFIYSAVVFVWSFGVPKPEIDLGFWMPTIKEALPFGITGSFVLMYTYVDSIILESMKGSAVVGWYNAAYRLVLVLGLVPTVINIAIFPSMSRFFISSEDNLKLIYEKYFKYMVMVSIPLGVGTTMLSDKIIYLIYGPGFENAILALQILIWTSVVSFVGMAFIKLFESTNRQALITRLTGACVVVNIVLNLIFIPQYSYVAAGIITVLTECVLVAGVALYAYRLGYGIPADKAVPNLIKVFTATVAMSLFLFYFKDLNLLVQVLISMLIYFGSYYILGGLDSEDKQLISQVLSKRTAK